MYILKAIILSKHSIRDNQIRVILFTHEYGKITGWIKKNGGQNADIGSFIEVLLERKGQENILHKIHTLFFPRNEFWDYQTTLNYLSLFHILKECLPEGMEHKDIFHDIECIIEFLSDVNNTKEFLNNQLIQLFILGKARILKKLGYLKSELFFANKELPIIYTRLDIASMKSMIYSKNIENGSISSIESAILESLHTVKNKI